MRSKAVTLQQVADAAGVSLNTASRAIREDRYVSEDARTRVREAAERLHYRPNAVARRMRGEKARLLGVFVNGIGWAIVHELVDHISEEARRLDYDLVVFSAENFHDSRRVGTSDLLHSLCDGLLMLLPNRVDTFLDMLERDRSNCVLIGFDAREIGLPVVVADNRGGGRMAVEHLLSLGHRRIAFVRGSAATGQSAQRERGYMDALEQAGIEFDPALIVVGNFTPQIVLEGTGQIMDLADPPTAFFCANDGMAMNVVEALHARKLHVPDDVSVIGFDDVHLASYVHPQLSTMRHPTHEIAVRAVHKLINMIESGTFESGRDMFATELVVRQSTGPSKRR
ncbi:MAG: LacI family DNA-binding transcriptional regulator [Pseudomonadota bacterium]